MNAHRSSPRRHVACFAVLGLALAVGVAACGDDDDTDTDVGAGDTTTTTGSSAGDSYGGPAEAPEDGAGAGGSAAVVAEGFAFSASSVAAGSEVTFANEDSAPHTMTADDGSFDSGNVAPGETATVTAPAEPGDYAFHCEIHPDMQATLTVEP